MRHRSCSVHLQRMWHRHILLGTEESWCRKQQNPQRVSLQTKPPTPAKAKPEQVLQQMEATRKAQLLNLKRAYEAKAQQINSQSNATKRVVLRKSSRTLCQGCGCEFEDQNEKVHCESCGENWCDSCITRCGADCCDEFVCGNGCNTCADAMRRTSVYGVFFRALQAL